MFYGIILSSDLLTFHFQHNFQSGVFDSYYSEEVFQNASNLCLLFNSQFFFIFLKLFIAALKFKKYIVGMMDF